VDGFGGAGLPGGFETLKAAFLWKSLLVAVISFNVIIAECSEDRVKEWLSES
jgi:hypothetical protein